MALVLADRVKETTTTTGTGTYTLAGAVTGFESFGSIGDGNTTYYCCTDGDDFEVGVGTYTSSGTTLARTTILESSNSDAAVNWTSGTRTIFCTLPADKAVFKDSSGNVNLPDNAEFQVGDKATTGDLRIRHNGTNTQIQNYTNDLQITNFADDSDVRIISDNGSGGTADYFKADGSTGESILYHYGTQKLATSSTGATVTGTVTADGVSLGDNEKVQLGASNDLQMYHNTYGYIDNNTSHLYIRNNVDNDDGGNIYIQAKSGENSIVCNDDSNVLLYFNNSLRINVSSSVYFYSNLYMSSYDLYVNDVFFNGNIDGSDNDKILLGTGDDLQIYHDGSNSWIDNSSSNTPLRIDGYGMGITGGSGTTPFFQHTSSDFPTGHYGWKMYYTAYGNSSEVFRTISGGVKVTSNVELTGSVIFEGSTADANETTLTVTDPTADRTITLPDATGTVILNSNLTIPFFQADGTSDTIALTADSKIPFTEADGTANNIPLTT